MALASRMEKSLYREGPDILMPIFSGPTPGRRLSSDESSGWLRSPARRHEWTAAGRLLRRFENRGCIRRVSSPLPAQSLRDIPTDRLQPAGGCFEVVVVAAARRVVSEEQRITGTSRATGEVRRALPSASSGPPAVGETAKLARVPLGLSAEILVAQTVDATGMVFAKGRTCCSWKVHRSTFSSR